MKAVATIDRNTIPATASRFTSEQVDLITVDLSFISVVKIIETLVPLLKSEGELILLIKPQFETEGKHLSRQAAGYSK